MNIIATSIDHHRAELSEREIFACSDAQADRLYETTKADPAIAGAVLINTCNRTELYLSLAGTGGARDGGAPDPFSMLCDILGVDEEAHHHLQRTLTDEDALRHLCLLAAGAESQLWGDSQIITQVGDAVRYARKLDAVDGPLNTMFRLGITAGKEIRTHVDLHIHDASTAVMATGKIMESPGVDTVLVVGNGAIGRMVAERLAKAGISTFMTLRQYNNGQAVIPEGVSPVPYAERYTIMEKCDGVVSATSSPHLVITRQAMEDVSEPPKIIIDMAVPRDVEETVGEMEGLQCYNIDDISSGHHIELKDDQLSRLEEYIEGYVEEYRRWEKSRNKMENRIRRLTSTDRDRSERKHFPLFMDSLEYPVVVIGGGNVAERRVMTLAEFGFEITIVSEDLTETLKRMVEGGAARWIRGRYDEALNELIDGAGMILACTNDRDINRMIGERCRSKGKLVNVCDARNESTFWFPAVALNDELTVGIVGRGTDHMNVKKAAARLRSVVESKDYK